MPNIVLTQKQFDKISEELKNEKLIESLKTKWKEATQDQRIFVLEYLKVLYPEKKKKIQEVLKKEKSNNINEAWYNTVLDLVGWVDPTGIADALNGVIYLTQGEYLFGFLSFVSAVPYAGDVIAKPVMYALKLGKPSAKALNGIMKLSKAGKSAEAATELAKLSASGGIIGTFVKGMTKIAGKLEELVKAMPAGPLKGFKNTILEWIQLFKGAGRGTAIRTQAAKFTPKFKGVRAGSSAVVRLSKKDQIKNLEELIKLSKSTPGMFSGYRTGNKLFSWKTFWGGMPQLMGRNRSVRALMRKTKWYLGLLDFLGIGNFVGPDELQQQMGDAKFEKSIADYNNTDEARQYAQEDFGSEAAAQEFLNKQDGGTSQTTAQPSSEPRGKTNIGSFVMVTTIKSKSKIT